MCCTTAEYQYPLASKFISENLETTFMGGLGSGRHGSGRRRVEQMLALDAIVLDRHGVFRAPLGSILPIGWPSDAKISAMWSASGALKLLYRHRQHEGDEWRDVEQLVPVTTTRVHLGGERHWFRCPRCDDRCRILYAGPRFMCRQCHRLRYTSQVETKADRASQGMFKVAKKLAPNESFNGLPPRPAQMRCAVEHLFE